MGFSLIGQNTLFYNTFFTTPATGELLMSDYKEPHKQVFNIPVGGGRSGITSVVCDQCDFDKMCDKLEGIIDLATGSRADNNAAGAIREAKHLPMAARGTKTQWLFDIMTAKNQISELRRHRDAVEENILGLQRDLKNAENWQHKVEDALTRIQECPECSSINALMFEADSNTAQCEDCEAEIEVIPGDSLHDFKRCVSGN